MSANTSIEWCDHTFNPWIGCTKVSPGCDNCYAERREDLRLHRVQWGTGQQRHRTKTWRDPVKWNARAAAEGRRYRVFCASLADVFDNEVPDPWRWDLFRLIAATPHLDWLLLTKRIGNARTMLNSAAAAVAGEYVGAPEWDRAPWANVWLGVTVVTQAEADRDMPKLLQVPARVRFLSIEPMLEPITLPGFNGVSAWCPQCKTIVGETLNRPHELTHGNVNFHAPFDSAKCCSAVYDLIHWVICGGESGPGARPMEVAWARSMRQQCKSAGVAFFMKQLGAQPRGWCASALQMEAVDRAEIADDFCDLYEAGECATSCGRCVMLVDRKGGDTEEWPEDLRVREFPHA